jgi:hypothetical protein
MKMGNKSSKSSSTPGPTIHTAADMSQSFITLQNEVLSAAQEYKYNLTADAPISTITVNLTHEGEEIKDKYNCFPMNGQVYQCYLPDTFVSNEKFTGCSSWVAIFIVIIIVLLCGSCLGGCAFGIKKKNFSDIIISFDS